MASRAILLINRTKWNLSKSPFGIIVISEYVWSEFSACHKLHSHLYRPLYNANNIYSYIRWTQGRVPPIGKCLIWGYTEAMWPFNINVWRGAACMYTCGCLLESETSDKASCPPTFLFGFGDRLRTNCLLLPDMRCGDLRLSWLMAKTARNQLRRSTRDLCSNM